MAHQSYWNAYMEIPAVTRAYTTACVITTLAVHMELVSPYDLYFNPHLVIHHHQWWRLFTNFLFFGTLSFNFVFNIIFTYRYCRTLEESSFRGRTSDFVMMFFSGAAMTLFIAYFANLIFLGHAFTLMLVYVWSRRNPMVRMNFFGILNFQYAMALTPTGVETLSGIKGSLYTVKKSTVKIFYYRHTHVNVFAKLVDAAPLLPLVILGFSLLLGNSVQIDLIGITVGHMYYFLEDVFPNQPGGFRILKTPRFLKMLFDPVDEDPSYNPLPEDRPGGFQWGAENAPPPEQPQPAERHEGENLPEEPRQPDQQPGQEGNQPGRQEPN